MSDSYSPSDEALIRQALSRGQAPLCPRCGSRLRRTPVLPPAAVSYVRDRILLECDSCGRKTVLDRG